MQRVRYSIAIEAYAGTEGAALRALWHTFSPLWHSVLNESDLLRQLLLLPHGAAGLAWFQG